MGCDSAQTDSRGEFTKSDGGAPKFTVRVLPIVGIIPSFIRLCDGKSTGGGGGGGEEEEKLYMNDCKLK